MNFLKLTSNYNDGKVYVNMDHVVALSFDKGKTSLWGLNEKSPIAVVEESPDVIFERLCINVFGGSI